MFTATKIFKIPLAHRLSLHKGRCQNIHGHTIKVEIEIERNELNDNFMVIDFYDLKEIVNKVLDDWDHALLVNSTDYKAEVNITGIRQRVIHFTAGDPTSENMCFLLYNILFDDFRNLDPELTLKSVTVWESDESKAKYEPDKE